MIPSILTNMVGAISVSDLLADQVQERSKKVSFSGSKNSFCALRYLIIWSRERRELEKQKRKTMHERTKKYKIIEDKVPLLGPRF